MPARQFDIVATLGLLLLCTITVCADEAPKTPTSENEVAVVTDSPVTSTPDPRIVAREILKLQEEMGGSIVSRWEPQLQTPLAMRGPHRAPAAFPPLADAGSPIVVLRETAWQLEQSAYVLESLDLYEQADDLRTTANRLRHDARELKVANSSKVAK